MASTTDEAVAAVDLTDAELKRMAAAARERTLAEHTSDSRAKTLEAALNAVTVQPAAESIGA